MPSSRGGGEAEPRPRLRRRRRSVRLPCGVQVRRLRRYAAVVVIVRRSSVVAINFRACIPCVYIVSDGMLSRDSFRADRNFRDGPSAADNYQTSSPLSPMSVRAVALLSVRVYDRPELNVPSYYADRPSSCSSASASSAAGPRRNAAHVHRRACARRGAMRRAYSTPPPKVRTLRNDF